MLSVAYLFTWKLTLSLHLPVEQGREESMFEELSSKWYTSNPFARSSEQCAANAAAPTLVDTNVDQNEYHNLLTEFYQKHNADKVSEVSKTLETYKVKALYYSF